MGKHSEHLQKLSKDLENVMLRGILENGGVEQEITPEEYFEGNIFSDFVREADGKRIWQLSSDYLMLNLTDMQFEQGDDTVQLSDECAKALKEYIEDLDKC